MPAMTAGRPADADEIRSYADIVAAHHALLTKAAAGKGMSYTAAAKRLARLGRLYRKADEVTNEIRAAAEQALTEVRQALRTMPTTAGDVLDQFSVADIWLDRLELLAFAPTDGR